MTNPVRIGIVGCGSVMERPYMSQIERLSCRGLVEVIAACDTSESKREFVRSRFGITNFYTDSSALLAREDIDLVLVLTSMREHGPIPRAALEAGKHVLVEKPMAVDLEQASALVELAKTSKGYLLCAPHIILSATYQSMWRHLHRGDIGDVHLARARYGWAGPSWGKWFYEPGGGAMFDLGIYNVTSLTGWLGPVKRVTAMIGTGVPERIVDGEPVQVETEDTAQLLLDFGNALFAVVTTGFTIQKYRSPALELYGTRGTLQMLGDDWRPEGYELWMNDVGSWQVFYETERQWPWTDGLRHLVECIQNGTQPIIRPEHAYHALEIILKARQSARDGRIQDIESTFVPPRFETDAQVEPAHLSHDRSYAR